MILTSLHLQRFGRFTDASWEFRPGLNVIRGPNEAGKSTMREAIVRLLFDRTKVTTTSRDFLSMRTWGATQPFALECRFTVNGENFLLVKDFAARSAELRAPDGALTDDELIAERLHELLGVSSRDIYETTACVRQAEFAALGAGSEVSELLQQTLAGPGARAGVREVIDALASRVSDLQRGLDRPAKRPGPVQATIERIAQFDAQLARLRPIVTQAEDARLRVEAATKRQMEVARELEQANDLLERVERRGELERTVEDLSGRCTELERTIRQARELEREVAELETRLAGMPDLTEEQVQAVRKLEADRAQAEEALPAENARAEELESKAVAAEEALQAAQEDLPDAAQVRHAEELDRDIAAAEAEMAVARERAVTAGIELSAAESTGRARRSLLITAAVAIAVGAGLALTIPATWAWAIVILGALAGVYGAAAFRVPDTDELAERREQAESRAQELEASAREMTAELEALLREDDDVGALRARLEASEDALRQARDELTAARTAATQAREAADRARQRLDIAQARIDKRLADLGFESLEKFSAMADEVFSVRADLDQKRATLRGMLGDRTVAEMDEEFSGLNADRLGLQAELEKPELALAEMDAEQYAELQARVRDLTREQEALAEEIAEARAVAGHPEADPERLRSLEEQREAAAERLERLRERLDALKLAHELLKQAHRETLTSAIEVLEPRCAELLRALTRGRYEQISFDRTTLAPAVYSPEKGDEVDPDEELSCATREQVYLAARLALTRLLWPEVCPPIMLDDPLVNFDPERRREAVEIIGSLASEAQVLLFTCQDSYDAAADHVIVLERE